MVGRFRDVGSVQTIPGPERDACLRAVVLVGGLSTRLAVEALIHRRDSDPAAHAGIDEHGGSGNIYRRRHRNIPGPGRVFFGVGPKG